MDCQPDVSIADGLLEWFAANKRGLPWRAERTPYRVWVSEVMLQQTQVATAIPYFDAFMARFPTLESLAAAGPEDVLKAWEGLGYYARARNLHRAAGQIVKDHDGCLPHEPAALRALPGIGVYVAGMILSLAYGQDVPALDANGLRVLARLYGVQEAVSRSMVRRQLQETARRVLPEGRAGEFNEALIEFGALVCTPRDPVCEDCPIVRSCRAVALGLQHSIPVRLPRRAIPHRDVTAAVIWSGGRVLISQRLNDRMLGGLWEFPGGKCETAESYDACLRREIREELALDIEVAEPLVTFDHAYSHLHITLHVFHCRPLSDPPRAIEVADWRWVALDNLGDFPLSVADRRIAQALIERATDPGACPVG